MCAKLFCTAAKVEKGKFGIHKIRWAIIFGAPQIFPIKSSLSNEFSSLQTVSIHIVAVLLRVLTPTCRIAP